MFELEDVERLIAKIKVLGIGGCGCNALNSMAAANLFGVELIAVNTDAQHLETSLASVKIHIGASLTKGLGAGSNPVIGRQAAEEDKELLFSHIEGADMIFIAAGMGGGTGTGAAPVAASIARELGILTVGVVTRPFYYEGRKRLMNADEGIKELKKHVDTLIVIPNDRIHQVVEKGTPLLKSFSIANDVLMQAIKGISDVILIPGLINLDFADVRAVMENAGRAVIGTYVGKGQTGAFEAAKKAVSNPLIEESSIEGARGILINITGGLNLSHDDVQEAASLVYDTANNSANIILGAVINPDMDDEIRVTVIATGLDEKQERIDLPQVKKWISKPEPISSGTERILSKNIPIPPEKFAVNSSNLSEAKGSAIDHAMEKANEAFAGDLFQNNSQHIKESEVMEQEKIKTDNAKNDILVKSIFPEEDVYDIPTFLRKKKT